MSKGNWKDIAAQLAARIQSGELSPGSRLPSGDDLAETLGVNRNTAHRAVEELQRQGLVVRRQGSGTIVAEPETKKGCRIALLVDGYSSFHNFPSGDLLRGIQDRIGDESTLIIADSKHDVSLEGKQLRRLARETDGILLYATELEKPSVLASLLEEHFPVVALDRIPHGVEVDAVVTDNYAAARSIVETLIERGHRRIAFMGFHKLDFSSVADRAAGYRDAMSAAGLSPDELVRWLPADIDSVPAIFGQVLRDTVTSLTKGDDPVTAIFCVEDRMGSAVVMACEQLKVAIPSDIEMATFNDWHALTLRIPWNIHRLIQRKYELGQVAANLLLDRIASPHRSPKIERVKADIILADAGLEESFASPTISTHQ